MRAPCLVALRIRRDVAFKSSKSTIVDQYFVHVIEKKFVFVLFGSFGFLYAKRACQIKCKVYVTVWRLTKKNALKKLRFDVKRAAHRKKK